MRRSGGGGILLLVAFVLVLGRAESVWAQREEGAAGRIPIIYHNSRSFRIPFNMDPAEKRRIKEVLLCVSDDQGRSWKPISRTTPDKPALAFRAPSDGPYWFAVQTLDTEGRYYPPKSAEVEPRMKVVIDTVPPRIILEPNGRRGGLASVRWEVMDEAIDLSSLVIEYQALGAPEWRQVPIRKPALLGQETWDAGTAEPIRVRATILDKAKNSKDVVVNLTSGTPSNPGSTANVDPEPAPPPIGRLASAEPDGLPQFPMQAGQGQLPAGNAGASNDFQPAPGTGQAFGGSRPFEPFGGAPAAGAAGTAPANRPESSGVKTLLVPSPKFNLQYAVENAAPSGPAQVELWVTQDGGRSWSRSGEDPDRRSPFPVDLGAEGTFGIKLVVLSAANQGDLPPVPGEAPMILVSVDSTPPVVRLDPVQVGTGVNTGKVAILWSASDLHIGPKSVTISVKQDGPNATWQPIAQPLDNTGQYIWTLPPNAPPKFLLKVEVTDDAGNVGSAETPENQPVVIDLSRPRSRILGVEPSSVRSGMKPAGGAFR